MSSLSENFSMNFRRAREKAQISQKALANQLDISLSYVSMLERGKRNPPLETIEQVAKALKIDPIDLLKAPKGRQAKAA
jgi:transcriptional regulator with XRE-family HTH domain